MKLTVQHQNNATSFTCQLQAPGGTIGRGEQNDLNLTDTSGELSSLQAIIRIDESRSSATILNMSSMGRVSVNDTPLGLSQESPVQGGDRILIGDYLIAVDASPALASAPAMTSAPAKQNNSSAKAEDSELSASPYDAVAFTGGAAGVAGLTVDALTPGVNEPVSDDPSQLPTWHPAYKAPEQSQPLSESQPAEHPLGTPINREPPPAVVPNTTVAPMPGSMAASRSNPEAAQGEDANHGFGNAQGVPEPAPPQESPAAPPENPDDIFKDLLIGPGVLPVGGANPDDRHPFEMESATNRNHHNPVELLRPEGLHHPSIDGDPLDTLPSDGAEKDRQTIFSDDSPTTLSKDTALDSHKEDNILETLRRAAHSGYKDRENNNDK